MTIPNSVTSLGEEVFGECSSLTNISVAVSNLDYIGIGGVLFDKAQETLIEFPSGSGGSYTIPNGVTSIGYGAFDGCLHLTSVTIPNSVTNIADRAFYDCHSVTSVTIPNSDRADFRRGRPRR